LEPAQRLANDPALLDHLEKTFADAYRKEIDQEENIWRSLPFFAATLALQLAVISAIGLRVGEFVNRHANGTPDRRPKGTPF